MPTEWHSDALAYFITYHTYGTWLHGRSEGSVDRQHNSPQSPFLDTDTEREQNEWNRLKAPPVILDAYQRYIVEQTIQEVCSHRGWSLHAMNVRTNHVHIVVSGTATPEKMMNDFKAYSTRRLMEAKRIAANSKVWSRHGSTRYLWKEDAVTAACVYVREGQGGELPGIAPSIQEKLRPVHDE